ncbi:hypothetical protein DFH06DRAFT_524494 [Mycena polygramma]|nr:hypothetical protein DFH06DRAFT_524494 [Mycena polygramma]
MPPILVTLSMFILTVYKCSKLLRADKTGVRQNEPNAACHAVLARWDNLVHRCFWHRWRTDAHLGYGQSNADTSAYYPLSCVILARVYEVPRLCGRGRKRRSGDAAATIRGIRRIGWKADRRGLLGQFRTEGRQL